MKRKTVFSAVAAVVCLVMMMAAVGGCAQSAPQEPAAPADAQSGQNNNEPNAAPQDEAKDEIIIAYQTPSSSDMFTKAFAEYSKTHPNVKLDVQVVDAGETSTKILAQASTKTLPDVSWWNSVNVVGSFDTGAFLDLTPYIDPGKFADGTFMESVTADGKYTVFPAEMQIQGFLVNTAMFKEYNLEIPKTFDDLLNCAKVFKENGKVLFGNGSADAWDTWGWYHWFELYGLHEQADALYTDGTLTMTEADASQAWYRLAELREAGAFFENASTVTYEIAKTKFLDGECACITTSTDWLTGIVDSELDKSGNIQYWFGIGFEDSKYSQNTCVKSCGNGYCVSSNISQEKLDVLLDFFDYFYSQEGADICIKDGLVLPVADYTPGVEVSALVNSIIDLTINTDRESLFGANNYALNRVDGNTDIWLDSALYIGTITCGCIDGSITKDELPEYIAEYDRLVKKMLDDYKALS